MRTIICTKKKNNIHITSKYDELLKKEHLQKYCKILSKYHIDNCINIGNIAHEKYCYSLE